ncbi:MAG: hypothetical protein H6Q74_2853 [Firmicutes bacterium]|nr:hypothetical protein [Bacillota bacterium]
MPRPNYYPPQYPSYWCPTSCKSDIDECPSHPDLCLLRDAATDERGAILDYLTCAINTCGFDTLFLDVAEDEMQHFIKIMQFVTRFDPVQAAELEKENLGFMVMKPHRAKAKPPSPEAVQPDQDVEVTPPNKNDLPAICCLTKALKDELHAINKYQRYMNSAQDCQVKDLFCELMNDEKEHVAEFTATLFTLTHEPLPQETD